MLTDTADITLLIHPMSFELVRVPKFKPKQESKSRSGLRGAVVPLDNYNYVKIFIFTDADMWKSSAQCVRLAGN